MYSRLVLVNNAFRSFCSYKLYDISDTNTKVCLFFSNFVNHGSYHVTFAAEDMILVRIDINLNN